MTPPPTSAAALERTGSAARRSLAAVAPPAPQRFAVFESKLRAPVLRSGLVSRAGLVNRLRAARGVRLATLVAPAGYGKTTLLAQWAARDERPFVWLSVDARDNDPLLLVRHLATAFDRVEPLDADVLDALEAPGPSVWEDAAPRLAAAVASRRSPFVAVLDDADAIRRGDSADLVAALAEHVPAGSMLVVVGRSAPALPIARLRASGGLLELGRRGSRAESARQPPPRPRRRPRARRRGRVGPRGAIGGLGRGALPRDEGPRRRRACEAHRVGRRRRPLPRRLLLVGAPVPAERGAAGVPAPHVGARARCRASSATRSSSGRGRQLELASIARAGLFLVPLDRHGGWYRYHRFFREALRRELEQHEASLVHGLHVRAADWLEAHDDAEGALVHARACGDAGRAGRILTTIGLPGASVGPGTVERWLDAFDGEERLEAQPAVAALGAWVHALRGRPEDAERWLASADVAPADGHAARRLGVAAALDRARAGGAVRRRGGADGTGRGRRARRACRPRAPGGRPRSCSRASPRRCVTSATTPTRRSPRPPRRRSAAARPTPTRSPPRSGRCSRRPPATSRPRSGSPCGHARSLRATRSRSTSAARSPTPSRPARSSATAAGTRRATPSRPPTGSPARCRTRSRGSPSRCAWSSGRRTSPSVTGAPRRRSSPSASGSSRSGPTWARSRTRSPTCGASSTASPPPATATAPG